MQEIVGRGERGIVEVVHDLDEFLGLLDPESRVHYELYWKAVEYSKAYGFIYKMEAGINLYGVTREGFVLICNLREIISWDSPELQKYKGRTLTENYNEWIKEKWTEFEQKAKELGATPGKFEFVRLS